MILKNKIKKIIDAIESTDIKEIEISSFWGFQKIKLKKGVHFAESNLKQATSQENVHVEEDIEENINKPDKKEKDPEVEIARNKVPLEDLKKKITALPKTKDFIEALQISETKPALIAEIKKASPSRGIIRENFDPKLIAKMYQEGGADCISVLTDKKFFYLIKFHWKFTVVVLS